MNVMIDSNILDRLYDNKCGITENILDYISDRKLTLYCTRIQEEEISNIAATNKKTWMRNFMKNWVTFIQPPFAYDIPGAGWNQSTWGSEEEFDVYNNLKPNAEKHNHIKDKLIVISSLRINDDTYFVSDDKILIKAIKKAIPKLNTLNWEQFIEILL